MHLFWIIGAKCGDSGKGGRSNPSWPVAEITIPTHSPASSHVNECRTGRAIRGERVFDLAHRGAASRAAAYRDRFDELEARKGEEFCEFELLDAHFDERLAWDICTNSKILDCIEALIGPDILLMATHFFCKFGPRREFVAWHQDVTYWGLEPARAASAWYAVDDSRRDNGCMRVVPGSHRDGVRRHGTSPDAGNLLSINQAIHLTQAEHEAAVDIELEAGQFSIHDGLIIHGSSPNRSSRRRCGLTSIYLPANVRQVEKNSLGGYWFAIPMRGEAQDTNLNLVPAPFHRAEQPSALA